MFYCLPITLVLLKLVVHYLIIKLILGLILEWMAIFLFCTLSLAYILVALLLMYLVRASHKGCPTYMASDNWSFTLVGNGVYKPTIGIPMGTDCAPQLTNLFLFHYKYTYMKIEMAKMFSNTVRYIDDLLLIMLGLKKITSTPQNP